MLKFIKSLFTKRENRYWLHKNLAPDVVQEKLRPEEISAVNMTVSRITYVDISFTPEQIQELCAIWNKGKMPPLSKYLSRYYLTVQMKDGRERFFRSNGSHISERDNYTYDIDGSAFFRKIVEDNGIDHSLITMSHHPLFQNYWVLPKQLLAGESIFREMETLSEIKTEELNEHQITDIICLQENQEYEVFSSIEWISKKYKLHHFPLVADKTPSKAAMKAILDTIDKLIAEEKKIYLQSEKGIGRTGMVVGCYLIRHKLANVDNVLRKIHDLQLPTTSILHPSPELDSQIDFVKNWQKDE